MTKSPDESSVPFVLVVDDNSAVREMMRELLQYEGYQVDVAASANQAHQMLEAAEIPPKLIISDLLMPDTDGYQFMLAVRREEADHHIPFLFISGQETTYLLDQPSLNGVIGYLSKPFSVADLLAIVARVVGHR